MKQRVSRTLRKAAAAVAVLASVVSMSACGANSATSNGNIVSVFPGTTGTINENFNPFSPTALAPTLGVIYETLYWYNLASESDPTPMLATDYEWNEDGSELVITTREGVTWQDGEPFSARDVAFTFNLIHDTPALNASGSACTAEVIDDNHVRLVFPTDTDDGEPFTGAYMQEGGILAGQAIVPEHLWKDIADPVSYTNSDPVGTGAFKLSKFTSQSYMLEAYDGYWNGAPKIDGVRYITLNDASAATSALLAGEVDWMSAYIANLDVFLESNKDIDYANTPRLTTVIMTCSNADMGCAGPQTDPAVRQAIYYAMDRDQLNRLAGGGYGEVASPTLLMSDRDGQWITDKDLVSAPQDANVEKAAEILDEAGWVMGDDGVREKDGEKLTMTIQTVAGWSDYILINDTLKQQLAKVGIELETTQTSWNEWNNNETTGNYQLSLDSIGLGVTDDPYYTYSPRLYSENTTEVGVTSSGQNYARYVNAEVDEAIENAAGTDDKEERKAYYAIVQERLIEDLPTSPSTSIR
ncbi:ABC transporter substrate-binding protein [Bifidobacterium lemurum]|uniref:ABC transporter substrate-binding protein n=1 Tax=Bifidobacterium lemurum TaxID=1603886 RepID=A0A261FUJ6_9BIFI|nr:ABC transporter substrate-binding protein [Bifidobacterium lemurum]OZG62829.1 ABC transporter substrate-binding protein [Bifidobacterium lemurum]